MKNSMLNVNRNQKFQSLNELMDNRFSNYPDEQAVAFVHPCDENNGNGIKFQQTTFGQMNNLINQAALSLSKTFPPRQKSQNVRYIAILTKSDFTTLLTIYGLFRLGHATLIISPNNSIDGVCHLMKTMQCTDLIFSQDRQAFVNEIKKTFLLDQSILIEKEESFDKNKPTSIQNQIRTQLTYEEEMEEIATVLHSSGSTGLPKPLPMSHTAWCANLIGSTMHGVVTLPLYHFGGLQAALIDLQRMSGLCLLDSSFLHTSNNLLSLAKAALEKGLDNFNSVPLTLKLLSEIPSGLEVLARYKLCSYLGSACPKVLGDRLVEAGVKLVTFYGATESGFLMSSIRDFEKDKDWQLLRPRKNFSDFMKFDIVQELSDGEKGKTIAELVIKKGWPSLSISNRPDGSYATSDLLILHPTIPFAGTFFERCDDSLVHVNGEKTNPLLIEQDLRTSDLIRDAFVFGSGKMHTGCLIIPYNDKTTIDDLLPVIKMANKNAQTHSRLMKEMIVLLPSTDQLITTDKSSVIRFKTSKKYEKIIEATYKAFEEGCEQKDRKQIHTLFDAQNLIRSIVFNVFEEQNNNYIITSKPIIGDDDNIFDYGFDSLAVIRVGNLIRQQIKLSKGLEFSDSIPFQYPTINSLARFVIKLSAGMQNDILNHNQEEDSKIMKSLLRSFVHQIQPRSSSRTQTNVSSNSNPNQQIILLTGATGSLGAHLLADYATKQDTQTIICLCRAKSDKEARERVERSLEERKLASLKKFQCKIICLKTDLSNDQLGLQPEVYSSLLKDVTCIVHAAWPVNFSMGIQAFQSSLQGCLNLINFASKSTLKAPPEILFCSSIAAVGQQASKNGKDGLILEQESTNPLDAIDNGYGQSKWIAENIFTSAPSKVQGLKVTIARIGQLCGDLENGVWNENEAYPLLIKTAATIGCLPDLSNHRLYWLPVDIAAKMLVELSNDQEEKNTVRIIQVSSKEATNWQDIFETVKQIYPTIKQVSILEWVEQLGIAKDQQDPKTNPAIKLLDYYKNWIPTEQQEQSSILTKGKFDTSKLQSVLAKKRPEILQQCGVVNNTNLKKMVNAWQQSGFLSKIA